MSLTERILAEIARTGSTQRSIAGLYAQGIRDGLQSVDWPSVNHALLKRYAVSGVNHIKSRAWKLAGY